MTSADPSTAPLLSLTALRRHVVRLLVVGGLVQIVLSAYFLAMAHDPRPHDVPVGYVAADASAGQVQAQIEQGGTFVSRRFASADTLVAAVRAKTVYGGVDLTDARPHAYVATGAGIAAATAIRTTFQAVIQDQTSQQVGQLTATGLPVSAEAVRSLTAPPVVTDVVPLLDTDRSGTSLGFLVQALIIGATVASMGLGRIEPVTRRSVRRGLGHLAVLVAYAAASAAAVLVAARAFGVVPAGASVRTSLMFLLLSLAVTGSVAGLVALVGRAGAGLGTAYFVIGTVISGASILPEFLPTAGRLVGQALPPGAGATAIRDSLYFPAASIAGPVLVLSLYAGIGLVVVLVSNALPHRSRGESVLGRPVPAAVRDE